MPDASRLSVRVETRAVGPNRRRASIRPPLTLTVPGFVLGTRRLATKNRGYQDFVVDVAGIKPAPAPAHCGWSEAIWPGEGPFPGVRGCPAFAVVDPLFVSRCVMTVS